LTVLLGINLGGLALLLFAATPASAFWLAVLAFVVFGFTLPLINGPISAIMQATVAPEMQGRVFTMLGSLVTVMTPLGLIIAGPLADLVNVRLWFVAAGGANLLMGGLAFFSQRLMNIEAKAEAATADDTPAAADADALPAAAD
jgi:DHA3 family macrolide efflux protein-like MFS transporter